MNRSTVAPPQPQLRELQIPAGAAPQVASIWDVDEAGAAITALLASMEGDQIARTPRPPSPFASDDGGGSSASGGGRYDQPRYYPALHRLQAGDVRLLVPKSILQLQQMLHGLPEPHRRQTLRAACPRLSDALESPWILTGLEASAAPCELTENLMKTWVVTLKITTKLLCLMQYQLDQQFCQELKEECFAEVAGKTMDDLIKVAYSFGDVKWAAHHILFMLPIFDALIEALYKIQEISFNTSKIIHKKVNDIFHKMVTVLYGVVETEHDIRRSEESVIHPATDVLLLVLEFFYRNRDMLEAVLGTQDYENDLHNHWISRLKKEAERIFKYEKDRQYIFILNNSWFLWQKTCDPKGLLSNEQVGRLCSLIQQYIKQYLDGYWVPLLTYLEVDSMRKLQHSSLDKFTAKFSSICKRQRQWPVITQLKMKLREEISKLIVPRYEIFFNALPANRSSAPWSWSMVSWKKEKKVDSMNTVHELDKEIRELFER